MKYKRSKTMSIQTENTTYTVDGKEFKGYLAWDDSSGEIRPGVLVFPEWWGLNDYIRRRTEQIAELGYVAMGVDMYGEGKTADNPDQAGSLMNAVLDDKQIVKARVEGAYDVLKSHSLSNPGRLGAIGYCFGGAMVLNMARMGIDLRAVVSFHGALDSFFTPAPGDVKAKVLVCHGAADEFIPQEAIEQFKSEMDAARADYEFIAYEGAYHGFSNTAATERGKQYNLPLAYNENADRDSWDAMKNMFEQNL
ncbi:MAG: Carboxymethylenebutenolidase [Deltaproteobacteria bacterium]|jgi:dienelactone hydrolase|nr:Carboxymethylenebutenolidase [Deltaproteobacteria bacterium]